MIFHRYSTSVYLLVLAVSDSLCLWTIVPNNTYRNVFNLDYHEISYVHCKILDWISLSSGFLSTWTIVNLTIERVLLTLYPIKAKTRLTPKVSGLVSMVTVLMSQLVGMPLMFSRTYLGSGLENSTNFSSCVFSSKEFKSFYSTTWSFIGMLLMNVLPGAMIITGNALIGTTLLKRKKQIVPVLNANQQNSAREKMALKLLFAIGFLHVIFKSPFAIYLVVKSNSTRKMSSRGMAVDQLIIAILHILLFSNYTFNFALYLARGSLFREECKEIITSLKKRFMKLHESRGASSVS